MMLRAALVVCLALLGACVPPHILKTGVLDRKAYFSASDLAVGVEFVQAGSCWRNVWMDVVVSPQSAIETAVDPMAFSLKASDTGLTIKHTARAFVGFQCSGCGCREPQERGLAGHGTLAPTMATTVKPGEMVRATLMFETGPGEAEFLNEFDLIYKGKVLHFGANGIHDRTPKPSSAKDDD